MDLTFESHEQTGSEKIKKTDWTELSSCLFESPHFKAEYVITADMAVLSPQLLQTWLKYNCLVVLKHGDTAASDSLSP